MKSEWHERLAAFKKHYGYRNSDLARMSGNGMQSVKNISQGEVPGWLRFAIQVWENEYRDFPIPENFNLLHKYGRVEVVENDGEFSASPMARQRASVLIGIDPGTHTGIAIKMHGDLKLIETVTIWKALNLVKEWAEYEGKENALVRVEDARLRTWFGNTGPERWKGAGSIGRDCAIWEEVLTDLKIPFEMVHPKNVKEATAAAFKQLTGWNGRTSKHAREAAWMIL